MISCSAIFMNISKLLLLVLFILNIGCSISDASRINETYAAYRKALLNNEGNLAYSFVDQRTRNYWDALFHKVVYANKKEILELGLVDKMAIIFARHLIPRSLLLSMNGQTYFEYLVNQGWVGKNSVSNLVLGDLGISRNFAIGKTVINAKNAPFHLHFYQEDGTWKIDVTQLQKIGGTALIQLQEESGKTEEGFIFYIVKIITGRRADRETVYLPLTINLKEPLGLPRET